MGPTEIRDGKGHEWAEPFRARRLVEPGTVQRRSRWPSGALCDYR